MKNLVFIAFGFFCLLFLFGCSSGPNPPDNLYAYKNVTVAKDLIPSACWEKVDCEMFSCMVSQCWCKSIPPEDGIVYRANLSVTTEEGAKSIVVNYLDSAFTSYDKSKMKAVKLNEVFYNVFYEVDGSEKVLTVAVDGTVMETVCGV